MPARPPSFNALLEAALHAQARRLAAYLVKHRARAYSRRPMTLETLCPGLSCAAPDSMIAIAKDLLARERQTPRRWFGFGGETPALNAHAVLLLGRTLRRAGRRC